MNLWPRSTARKGANLSDHWDVSALSEDGFLSGKHRDGFMYAASGLDGTFLTDEQRGSLHADWRSALRLNPSEELQIVFNKRVDFAHWIEEQMGRAFLSDNPYGRRILLGRLAEHVRRMGRDQPGLLAQQTTICFWTEEKSDMERLRDRRASLQAQLSGLGFSLRPLNKAEIERRIYTCASSLNAQPGEEPEWPAVHIMAGQVHVEGDCFRALELDCLPEAFTELGMIQALTSLPYPLDIGLRLRARETRPIVNKLTKKRNLLEARRRNRPAADADSQITQIDTVLRSLADQSESLYDMSLTVGLRMPESLSVVQRRALADLMRAAGRMNFCEFAECTLGTFDAYLECIPGFRGRNIRRHTVLGSNACHFLPFFRPATGDRRTIVSFQTRENTLYAIDPADARLANYNWLVSGTSGAGKSFFVNSLLAQSLSLNPDIFIVDIGGSYNKLTRFLGGRVMSLEPGHGFELSPFFLAASDDPGEERMRRQHILQIFLEMTRIDGRLPAIEIRHLLQEQLDHLLDLDSLPAKPISYLCERLQDVDSPEARRLRMLLSTWSSGPYGQFLDNNRPPIGEGRILTFDLKGLTEFEDLARVVQLIVCAGLWARVRQAGGKRFSWIVLDEVAFSLLKTQPLFVDELVATLRKYYAGAVIVVQDIEKITSNPAGAGILQNTQSKAFLQQRGDSRHYSEALALTPLDQWAIHSLRREKGGYSDIFLMRDDERTVIRHVPSELEYWLSTTSPEDRMALDGEAGRTLSPAGMIDFVERRKERAP